MRVFKDKTCLHCGKSYTPVGSSSKFCSSDCRRVYYIETGKSKYWRDKFNAKAGVRVGIGSGGLTGSWEANPNYSYGRHSFVNYGRKLKDSGVPCNRCGKDLRNAGRGEWCSHHKDHNRRNNTPDNCELLCKKCHQIHHHKHV